MTRRTWLDDREAEAGTLLHAARGFLARYQLDVPPDGLATVRLLGRMIDGFAHDEIDGDESEFIEEAGALLALLLLDALSGSHRVRGNNHRVALGAYGFFDPFGAIDAALSAESPKAELASQVRLAEAEARGEGPISRIVQSLAIQLSPVGRSIVEQFELLVVLDDGTEIDLSRIARATDGEPLGAVHRATARVVSMLTGETPAEHSWEHIHDHLLPRIVSERFVRELPDLAHRPLGADARVAYVVQENGRARFVRKDEVETWPVPLAQAHQIAVANLAQRSACARFAAVDTECGSMVIARSGDGLDSARLLLPGLREVLSTVIEGPVIAAIPHRDTLLAASALDATLVQMLRARVADEAARAPHPITATLFEITPDGPSPLSTR